VHCSRVFRSSVPSDALPSSPCERPSGNAQGEHSITRSMEWGVGPGGGVPHRGGCPAGTSVAGHILGGTWPGPVRSQGRVARCVIQKWVARAQRAATRLESAWEQWRAVWTRGRARAAGRKLRRLPTQGAPGLSPGSGLLQSGPLQVIMTEPALEGTGEYPSSALPGAPVALGRGRQTPDKARDLAGWSSGELPGQVAGQLVSWPPGLPSADQPPTSALRRRAAPAHRKST
jgi:hypothetical protein